MAAKIYKNYFDVVILPQKEVQDYAISLSKQLYKYGSKWALGKKSFLPHLTLYHIPVKPKNFDDFVAELEIAVKDFRTGDLKTDGIRLYKSLRAVSLMTDKPDWLKKLYLRVIKKTLKYFDWNYGVEKLWREKSSKAIANIKKYGTPLVGRYFMPHITLAVFKNDKDMIKGSNKLKLKEYKIKVKSIFICELGESHSCQRIVKQIYF